MPGGDNATKSGVLIVVDGELIRIMAPKSVPVQRLVEIASAIDLDHPAS